MAFAPSQTKHQINEKINLARENAMQSCFDILCAIKGSFYLFENIPFLALFRSGKILAGPFYRPLKFASVSSSDCHTALSRFFYYYYYLLMMEMKITCFMEHSSQNKTKQENLLWKQQRECWDEWRSVVKNEPAIFLCLV